MYLIKCKCGCAFTITDTRFANSQAIQCPECLTKLYSSEEFYLSDIKQNISEAGFTINKVPDGTKLSIKFDI